MDTLIKADIFFFISSIATILVTILICVVLYYLISFARTLHKIIENIQTNLKDSEEFIADLKERLENNLLFQLFFPASARKSRTHKNNKKSKKTT